MGDTITRRSFIKSSASFTAASLAVAGISCQREKPLAAVTVPRRLLGKTNLEISQLCFGGGSQFLKNANGVWERMLEHAVEMGVNLFDTASSYQWGASMSSEQRFGEILPSHRDNILISTKFDSRNPDDAKREIEQSLKNLKTDHVDLLLMHSVEKSEDLDAFADGVYPMLLEMKEQGVTKFIGFSSMNSAEKSKDLIERFDIDACFLAMNPTQYGNFAEIALPAAKAKNVGVIAMKVMRDLVGKDASPQELISYALGHDGVASVVIGHVGMQTLVENAAIIAEMADASNAISDVRNLEKRLAHLAGPHVLCWARQDYFDGKMC